MNSCARRRQSKPEFGRLRRCRPGSVGARWRDVSTTEHVCTSLPEIYNRELVDVIFEQAYCRIGNLVDKGLAKRQAASRDLHGLATLGVLRDVPFGREKLFIHPRLIELLSRDSNYLKPYV